MQVHKLNKAENPLPHNIEAEQQLLGAILAHNENMGRAAQIISAADFFEPTHADIFEVCEAFIDRGDLASPVTLKNSMAQHPGLAELGGPAYLARLVGASISSFAVGDYANMIRDNAQRRLMLDIFREGEAALVKGADRPGDVIGRVEAALMGLTVNDATLRPQSFLSATTDAISEVAAIYGGEDIPQVPVPWSSLWKIMPTFRRGDHIVLGGRPSMGKTAIALSLATHAAREGHPVVIVSLEMTPQDLALRALSEASSMSGEAVAYTDMTRAPLTETQMRRVVTEAKANEALPIWFLNDHHRDLGALVAGTRSAIKHARSMMPNGKLPLVVIDYMQLIAGPGRGLYEQTTAISKALKGLAKREEVPVLSLAQLSRQVEGRDDKRPKLSDLRDSGQIEQDADAILFAYRHEYYLEREQPDDLSDIDARAEWEDAMESARGRLDLIVAKQRRGPIGTAVLRASLPFNRIWDDGHV